MKLSTKQLDSALKYNQRRGYPQSKVREIQKEVGTGVDGVWGPNTCQALADWQAANKLVADGKCGPKTMRHLFPQPVLSEAAKPSSSAYPVLHELPKIKSMWGYDHCPNTYLKPCPAWDGALQEDSFENGLLRLVSGSRSDKGQIVFSRSPDSWISLDEFSIGFAHWWADTAPDILEAIADELPSIARHAWGGAVAVAMTDLAWIRDQIRVKRGKRPHQHKYDWLLSGWYEIGLHPDVIGLCVQEWLECYPPHGVQKMKAEGWKRATTLAGLIRMANSRGNGGMKSLIRKATALAETNDETDIVRTAFYHHTLYDHPNRWDRIKRMPHFKGTAPKSMNLAPLAAYEGPVVRGDGSTPGWA